MGYSDALKRMDNDKLLDVMLYFHLRNKMREQLKGIS